MRFVRFQIGDDAPRFGWVYEDQVGVLDGIPFGEYRRLEASFPLSSVRLLAPVQPSKILGIERNYIEHNNPHTEIPTVPMLFLKPPSSVIGPGGTIILPPQSQRVTHEVELAVVIGKRGRWIQADQAQDYILGYTVCNDVTAQDLESNDGHWTRSKSFDTFCPLGPWIETSFDPSDGMLTCYVNSELRQMGSTRDMVFSVNQLIAFASSIMTLEAGDVLLTGTPAGSDIIVPGDMVEVTVEGIGTLRNLVKFDSSH